MPTAQTDIETTETQTVTFDVSDLVNAAIDEALSDPVSGFIGASKGLVKVNGLGDQMVAFDIERDTDGTITVSFGVHGALADAPVGTVIFQVIR